jgi:tetratricopeptide (TPR) repeat protein
MPQPDDSVFDAGRRAHEAGDLEGAIAAYQRALLDRSNESKLLFLLGNLSLEAGDGEAALGFLEPAAARERNHPSVIGSLAQAYFAAAIALAG